MEFASRLRWFLVLGVGFLAILLIGWGLLSIARSAFSSTDSQDQVNSEPIGPLYEIDTTGKVSLTIEGPVVANDKHRSARIDVTPSTVTATVFKSYGQEVVGTQSYANTNASYRAFLGALGAMNATSTKEVQSTASALFDADGADEEGVCATGKRYIIDYDSELRVWSTSCSAKEGTANFSMNAARSLFEKQVPDYRTLLRGTGL